MSIGAITLLVTLVTTAAFAPLGVLPVGRLTIDIERYDAGFAFGKVSTILVYCLGLARAVTLLSLVVGSHLHLMPLGQSLDAHENVT